MPRIMAEALFVLLCYSSRFDSEGPSDRDYCVTDDSWSVITYADHSVSSLLLSILHQSSYADTNKVQSSGWNAAVFESANCQYRVLQTSIVNSLNAFGSRLHLLRLDRRHKTFQFFSRHEPVRGKISFDF